MSYQGRRRAPRKRLRDRIRAWWYGTWEDDPQELTDDNGEPIDLPPVGYEPRVIRTAKVSGVHLPLSGDHVNPWINCAFTKDVPRADERPPGSEVAGPGYRQNVPRRGREVTAGPRRDHLPAGSEDRAAPGHLGMFDLAYVRSPWPPRPDDTVIISAPRICAGRIALLAGA